LVACGKAKNGVAASVAWLASFALRNSRHPRYLRA
jgi:hypothetical protein